MYIYCLHTCCYSELVRKKASSWCISFTLFSSPLCLKCQQSNRSHPSFYVLSLCKLMLWNRSEFLYPLSSKGCRPTGCFLICCQSFNVLFRLWCVKKMTKLCMWQCHRAKRWLSTALNLKLKAFISCKAFLCRGNVKPKYCLSDYIREGRVTKQIRWGVWTVTPKTNLFCLLLCSFLW